MEGVFISFEGVEGSGKSTLAAKLYEHIVYKSYEAILLREPGSTSIGEQIRSVLLDVNNKEMDYYTECCLYAASRSQLVNEVIKPNLAQGKIVICDRFVDSSYAYQAMARGLDFDTVYTLNKPAVMGALPHITVFIDLTPEEGLSRRSSSGIMDRLDLESLSFHQKVYEGYKKLGEMFPQRYLTVDGQGSACEVLQKLIYLLNERLSYLKKEVIL